MNEPENRSPFQSRHPPHLSNAHTMPKGMARYRVLAHMSVGGSFTVRDLSASCGMNEATVRTVLSRDEGFIEPVGLEPTGKRGGQFKLYRVRPDRLEEVRRTVAASRGALLHTNSLPEANQESVELLAAVDSVLRLWPSAGSDEDRSQHLGFARKVLDDTIAGSIDPGPRGHMLRALVELAEAESRCSPETAPESQQFFVALRTVWEVLEQQVRRVSHDYFQIDTSTLRRALSADSGQGPLSTSQLDVLTRDYYQLDREHRWAFEDTVFQALHEIVDPVQRGWLTFECEQLLTLAVCIAPSERRGELIRALLAIIDSYTHYPPDIDGDIHLTVLQTLVDLHYREADTSFWARQYDVGGPTYASVVLQGLGLIDLHFAVHWLIEQFGDRLDQLHAAALREAMERWLEEHETARVVRVLEEAISRADYGVSRAIRSVATDCGLLLVDLSHPFERDDWLAFLRRQLAGYERGSDLVDIISSHISHCEDRFRAEQNLREAIDDVIVELDPFTMNNTHAVVAVVDLFKAFPTALTFGALLGIFAFQLNLLEDAERSRPFDGDLAVHTLTAISARCIFIRANSMSQEPDLHRDLVRCLMRSLYFEKLAPLAYGLLADVGETDDMIEATAILTCSPHAENVPMRSLLDTNHDSHAVWRTVFDKSLPKLLKSRSVDRAFKMSGTRWQDFKAKNRRDGSAVFRAMNERGPVTETQLVKRYVEVGV